MGTLASAFRYEAATAVTTLPFRDEVDDVADEVGTVVTTLVLQDEVDDVSVGTVVTTFRCGLIVPLAEVQ